MQFFNLMSMFREKQVVESPVKVTLTPSKDGDGSEEPKEQILTLDSDGDQEEAVSCRVVSRSPLCMYI